MGGARKFSVLLLAFACAAALSACGGGSSTATTAGGTAQTTTVPAETTEGGGSKGSSNGGGSGGGGSSEQGSSGAGGESGSSHERSSSFRTKGGDNSIQEFGDEGEAEERAEATKTITTFFSATKDKEWAKVCGVLAAKTAAQMEQFAGKIPKIKSKTCAGVIEVVNSSAPSQARPETIKGPVISLRRKGNEGFALYHGIDGKNYAFPLILEKGEWKMTSLGATPLSF